EGASSRIQLSPSLRGARRRDRTELGATAALSGEPKSDVAPGLALDPARTRISTSDFANSESSGRFFTNLNPSRRVHRLSGKQRGDQFDRRRVGSSVFPTADSRHAAQTLSRIPPGI